MQMKKWKCTGCKISAPLQTGPEAHPASYSMGTGSFPGVKRPERGVDNPPPPSAEETKTIQLYLYSPSGPSWPVLGWPLPFTFFFHMLQNNDLNYQNSHPIKKNESRLAKLDVVLSRFLSLPVVNRTIEHQTDTNTSLKRNTKQAHWHFVTIKDNTVELRAPFVDFLITMTAAAQIHATGPHRPTVGIAAGHEERAILFFFGAWYHGFHFNAVFCS